MAKSKPIGVRFDLDQFDLILKNNPQLKTPQSVLNFLMSAYETILVMNENFIISPINDLTPKEMIRTHFDGIDAEKKAKNNLLEPPKNLSGIDLSIWKAENWK